MPLKHFSVLVKYCCKTSKIVRKEGIGRKLFVHCITKAVKEEIGMQWFLQTATLSILSRDRSQARKTKREKELVVVRTGRKWTPTYIMCSLCSYPAPPPTKHKQVSGRHKSFPFAYRELISRAKNFQIMEIRQKWLCFENPRKNS